MGSGATKSSSHHHHADDEHTKDELTRRLGALKKLDSRIQNKILLELDRKMQDLMSEHETVHLDSEGNQVAVLKQVLNEEKLQKKRVPDDFVVETRVKRQLHKFTVKVNNARGLRNSDKKGKGDPYCVAYFEPKPNVKLMTSTVRNNVKNPFFGEELVFHGEAVDAEDLEDMGSVVVEVWDQDGRVVDPTHAEDTPAGSPPTRDDFLGKCVIPILSAPSTSQSYKLEEGLATKDSYIDLSFTKKRENDMAHQRRASSMKKLPSEALAEENNSKNDDGTVVRMSIDEMPPSEQQRFVNAVKHMMGDMKTADGTSEYFRLAGYHGFPEDYCAHRQELFPAWHRAYLLDFEQTLQKADVELGGNGSVGVPYWDWTEFESMPEIIREEFGDIPPALKDEIAKHGGEAFAKKGYQIHPDNTIRRALRGANLPGKVANVLNEHAHWRAASTRWSGGSSVETPHNDIHAVLGFPMTSVAYAAFHPIFFLHHCNVDRIYEAYIAEQPDSRKEFEATQQAYAEKGEENRFLKPLAPFKHPFTSEAMMPADTFKISGLGYSYANLPKRTVTSANRRMTAPPALCQFIDVDPVKLKPNTYALHVYVYRKDDQDKWVAPANLWDVANEDDPHYAGMGSVFGGKPGDCENCSESKPISILVDISKVLATLGATRSDVVLKVLTVDGDGKVATLEELMAAGVALSAPRIVGPSFDGDGGEALSPSDRAMLEVWLKQMGYAEGEAGVKDFQEFTGLSADGVVGPVTMSAVMQTRNDRHSDKAEVFRAFEPKSVVQYWVGTSPGYMGRNRVMEEVENCMSQWTGCTGVVFECTNKKEEATLSIEWDDKTRENERLFDGPGGLLAVASKGGIEFDSAEKWVLQGTTAIPGSFYFLPVLLHEMGHVLGFQHSSAVDDVESVMDPFYVKNRAKLRKADKEAAMKLYEME